MIPSLQAPSVPQHAAQTHAGRQQAEDLGRVFRMVMYPRYGSAGGGLLRLHSTYRHDLKIYSSDEGRVQVGGGGCRCQLVRTSSVATLNCRGHLEPGGVFRLTVGLVS